MVVVVKFDFITYISSISYFEKSYTKTPSLVDPVSTGTCPCLFEVGDVLCLKTCLTKDEKQGGLFQNLLFCFRK